MKRTYQPGALSAACRYTFAHLKSERIMNKSLRLIIFNAKFIFLCVYSVHFALMQNEPKDQDLDSSAKNKSCSLKILKLA